jgi:hypothetical protein
LRHRSILERAGPPVKCNDEANRPRSAHEISRKAPQLGLRLVWYRLAALFAVLGPGFITANVDNDPGGILTYSQAGAKYGYALLWTLIPTTVALIVVQEMASRMAVATGKGLSDLIREEFGLRIAFFTMIVLAVPTWVTSLRSSPASPREWASSVRANTPPCRSGRRWCGT